MILLFLIDLQWFMFDMGFNEGTEPDRAILVVARSPRSHAGGDNQTPSGVHRPPGLEAETLPVGDSPCEWFRPGNKNIFSIQNIDYQTLTYAVVLFFTGGLPLWG
jgi:hypothetical protein